MRSEQAFLDSLATREGRARYDPSSEQDLEALMESVRRHLARLLNARHGMCETLPDYGLPALVDLTAGSVDSVAVVENAIRTAIEKYEPRLRRVRVSHAVDDEDRGTRQQLMFRVDAVLVARDGEHRVWYETQVEGGGEFDVLG